MKKAKLASLKPATRTGRTSKRLYPPTEAELRQVQAFIDSGPFIAWMKTGAGDYFFQNAASERYFGIGPNDWFGVNDEQLHHNTEGRSACEHDRAMLASKAPLQTLESWTGADGTQRNWLMLRFPFQDGDGRSCIGGLGIDLTSLPSIVAT